MIIYESSREIELYSISNMLELDQNYKYVRIGWLHLKKKKPIIAHHFSNIF